MQSATVDFEIEVSNLTADAVNALANVIKKTPEQFAAFLLRKGFSNLSQKPSLPTKRDDFFAQGF